MADLGDMSLLKFIQLLDKQQGLNLSERAITNSVKVLEEQWFSTAEELRALDAEAFRFIELPPTLCEAILNYFEKGGRLDGAPAPAPAAKADEVAADMVRDRSGSGGDMEQVIQKVLSESGDNEFVMKGLQSLLQTQIAESGKGATLKKSKLTTYLKQINTAIEKNKKHRSRASIDYMALASEDFSSANKCNLCGGSRDAPITLECKHIFDKSCLHDHVMDLVGQQKAAGMKCPSKAGCKEEIATQHIQSVLDPEEFNQYLESTLMAFIQSDSHTFECPSDTCKIINSVEPLSEAQKVIPDPMVEKDANGKPLSPEAYLHFKEFRVRCQCGVVFCANCKVMPYHKGVDCEQHQKDMKAKACRFCERKLTPENMAKDAPGPGLRDVCTDEECIEKRLNCCIRVKDCGCPCNGVRGESEEDCLPCLKHDIDIGEEFCSICYVESLNAAPCIQIGNGCDHVFHYECMKKKVESGHPGARISFDFMSCPLCHKDASHHPTLQPILKDFLEIKERVEKMAIERLKYEGMDKDPKLKPGGEYHGKPLELALHNFLFYTCHTCKKPYFAGGYQCQEANAPFNAEELICPSCQPGSVDDCPKHGKDWLAFKCRYCCSFANWYCWGRTHFCGECHKTGVWQKLVEFRVGRNKKRFWEYPQCPGLTEKMTPIQHDNSMDDDTKERKMQDLTADPTRCPLKVPHPPNGMEFGLGCSMCEDKETEALNKAAAEKAKAEAEEKQKAFVAVTKLLDESPNGIHLKYTSDGDESGLFYFLGSCAKTVKWSNPADATFVKCSSSGLMNDSAPLANTVGRDLVRCVTKPIRNAYLQLDLQNMTFEPTHYSIRHYSSWDTECLRNWVLEGSNDGLSWDTLSVHKNDTSLQTKGQWHTWNTMPNLGRFRIFRIVQTGVNSNNHYYLAQSGIEFYGILHKGLVAVQEEDEENKIPEKTFNYTYDFDTNGIFYYLGTKCGRASTWQNPALLGQVTVSSSELAVKPPSVPAYAIVGRSLVRCVSMARPNMWFAIDLKDKRAKVTHYTLKHYNSWDTEALRNWKFEGSNDGVNWTVLRAHHNDSALNAKGATATWKIMNPPGYYSMFRLYQTGKNSNNHYYLACSGMELYGNLKQSPPLKIPPEGVQFNYSYDFDCNGLFYWLGTRGKKQAWRNSAHMGLVDTACSELASNPPSHPTSSIVGRSLVRCVSAAKPNMWFLVDLKDKVMEVTHYTIRHYSTWDTEALRNWVLEASNDGHKWIPLRQHNNDWALDKKGATFTWPIKGNGMRFRILRIRQMGPNSNNHHYLACSGLEFYGRLFSSAQPDRLLSNSGAPSRSAALRKSSGRKGGAAPVAAPVEEKAIGFKEGMQFTYVSDFDTNGIFYWLGTQQGTKEYRNPAMLGIVKVTSAPLASQSMPVWAACGREVCRCVTEPKKGTWFCFDLNGYYVIPTHYTLRHYDSWDTEALRNWKLEGSYDGKKWKTLITHKKDKALDKKGASYTWQIKGITKAYSMFKITQTGKNSNKHWYLALCGFELYGTLWSYRKK